jgi:hypothetical protein
MMIFKYVSDQGEIVDVIPEKFTPLTYSDLVANGGSAQQYTIEVFAKSIKLPKSHEQGPGTASFPITFRQPLTIYSLVEGGWLPPPFVLPANYLVDRNVIRTLVRITRRFIQTGIVADPLVASVIRRLSNTNQSGLVRLRRCQSKDAVISGVP